MTTATQTHDTDRRPATTTAAARWTAQNIPPQHGRLAVVTGTGGLGYETALALAVAGARIVIAGRDPGKGAAAVAAITTAIPGAEAQFLRLDLASLDSVAAFGAALTREAERVDILVNNAGVMTPPARRLTQDGFELQFGTNHLGHFALTAHLLPLLRRSRRARVVTLSSIAARSGAIDFDDLQAERAYRPMPAYAQSKLACLLFALEFSRRSAAQRWGVESLAAHPGVSRTDLLPNGAGRGSLPGLIRRFLPFLFQPAAQGALPTLFAATDPAARDGGYYGPRGISELRGPPAPAAVPEQALDAETARRLWEESRKLTGLSFG
ncbi:SDR family oxidoreductase [Roseomonas sp. F4]